MRGQNKYNRKHRLFRRDGSTIVWGDAVIPVVPCVYCGTWMPYLLATIDHVIPVAEGGPSTFENSALSCRECNHSKGGFQPCPQCGNARVTVFFDRRTRFVTAECEHHHTIKTWISRSDRDTNSPKEESLKIV